MKKLILIAVLVSFISFPALAEIDTSQCQESLSRFREPNLSCTVFVRLNPQEQEEVGKNTSGVILNVSAQAKINANKAEIVRSLSDPVVRLPRVNLICTIFFKDHVTKDAHFFVEPELTFKDDKVVAASLNMSKVTGIGFLGECVRAQLSSEKFKMELIKAANETISKLGQLQ